MEADSAASGESHAEHDHVHDARYSAGEHDDFDGVAADTEQSSQPSSHDTAVAMSAIANDETSEDRAEAMSEDEPLPVATPRRAARENRIHLVLSYPSLAVASIAMMLLMIVAFLAGRHTARPMALSGPSLEQIQNNKPSPDVLNLGATPTRTQLSQPNQPEKPAAKIAANEAPTDAGAAAAPTPDRRRVVGRNYIIAQSYPDPDNAAKAADVLVKNNIPVSVEQIDAAPGWYCVVTEVGFDRVSTDECDRYQKLIRDCNAAAKQARLKVFEPYLFKWK